jgi:subtilisin family serine protease
LACLGVAFDARADLDFARIASQLLNDPGRSPVARNAVPPAFVNAARGQVAVVAERLSADAAIPPGFVPAGQEFFALEFASLEDAVAQAERAKGFVFHWSPARHLLIDRALDWARVPEFRQAALVGSGSAARGHGVAVGLVDTGVAVTHPDFRTADGKTRVKWLIDFTRPATGSDETKALEEALGCSSALTACAVYDANAIDRLIATPVAGDEPVDNYGHGTHVASLAAGNGLSQSPPVFAGMAPEADLIVARVTDGQSPISDSMVLKSVQFIFDRAHEMGAAAVVNLSLGSDLGSHDGTSTLERGLSSFVGPDQPGRAIVVAAGNSAGLFRPQQGSHPLPYGIHTEVHVPRESPTVVPILTPEAGTTQTHGSVSCWLSFRAGDQISIAIERSGRSVGGLVAPGVIRLGKDQSLNTTIANGVGSYGPNLIGDESAVVSLQGEWPTGESFGLRLEGHGSASLWLEGGGDLDPGFSVGPLFPLAQKEGTINEPASAPELIAVGATLNRTDWVDVSGESVLMPENGALANSPPDTIAFFSSAGPNALGGLKPDIVAPGANVIGALSPLADPRINAQSVFYGGNICVGSSQCLLVDDFHAVASGTSMASPIVAGAIALLFEQEPALTQPAIRALLQGSARPLSGVITNEQQIGVGALDVASALSALRYGSAIALPSNRSWLSLASSYARPDPEWPLVGFVELRDETGQIADGFDPRRLSLAVDGASVGEPLTRLGPGFYRFSLLAAAGSGGATLRVGLRFDATTLAERSVPIAVDRGALGAVALARGGCALGAVSGGGGELGLVVLALLGLGVPLKRRAVRAACGRQALAARTSRCALRKCRRRRSRAAPG